jgi:hypothetical protein
VALNSFRQPTEAISGGASAAVRSRDILVLFVAISLSGCFPTMDACLVGSYRVGWRPGSSRIQAVATSPASARFEIDSFAPSDSHVLFSEYHHQMFSELDQSNNLIYSLPCKHNSHVLIN